MLTMAGAQGLLGSGPAGPWGHGTKLARALTQKQARQFGELHQHTLGRKGTGRRGPRFKTGWPSWPPEAGDGADAGIHRVGVEGLAGAAFQQ